MLAPMGAMALLTFLVLGLSPLRRFRAVRAGHVTAADFCLGESAWAPADAAVANRNYMNLLELPVLFYVVGVLYCLADRIDAMALGLAWTSVGLRAAHSAVHLTYNNVMHRLAVYATSNAVLMGLWARFFVKGASGAP